MITAPAKQSVPMLKMDNISKYYGGEETLAPLSLSINKGETVAVIGPSGAGKTTLLNILGTIVQPDRGQVLINGMSSKNLKPGRQLSRMVGVMHQQLDLIGQLSVINNVLAGRLGEWGLLRSLLSLIIPQEKALAVKALERVGIPEKLYQKTSRLSGGEQQRVAMARILVQQPQAILADEPISSLDPTRAVDILSMLVNFSRENGQTLVVSLHSVEYALQYFNRIIALRHGKIFFDRPANQVTREDMDQLFQIEEEANERCKPWPA
ncbi:ATP-binding cassette domain-containing protein [Metallumcola ferriviriculae]|uniref:ATP-binding cassette domain-containing protein n=1 Tax=Metallumcola ferriviriculae TaxID=3039180 RepID=A0AAU0UMQ3_9FIRM|nr:ATP-binding cassette domain-containing protein [Desulfitibacteraceae bacterium MK1]